VKNAYNGQLRITNLGWDKRLNDMTSGMYQVIQFNLKFYVYLKFLFLSKICNFFKSKIAIPKSFTLVNCNANLPIDMENVKHLIFKNFWMYISLAA
jgi:hypothetical protein